VSPRLIDLTGKRFGRLTVIGVYPERKRYGRGGRSVAVLWALARAGMRAAP
jgi:hypothetical protein